MLATEPLLDALTETRERTLALVEPELPSEFTVERVRADLAAAGLTLDQWLTDEQGRFALSLASRAG